MRKVISISEDEWGDQEGWSLERRRVWELRMKGSQNQTVQPAARTEC